MGFFAFENTDLTSVHIYVCVYSFMCIQHYFQQEKKKRKNVEKLKCISPVYKQFHLQVNDKKIFQNMKANLESQNSGGKKAPVEAVSPGPLLSAEPARAGCSGLCPGGF